MNKNGGSPLFSLLKKYSSAEGTVGVGLHADGISVAHILRNGAGQPQLQACGFGACAAKAARREALTSLVKRHGLGKTAAVFVLEPGTYHLLLVEPPAVEAAELRAAVRWRVKDLIDFPVAEAVVDAFEIPAQYMRGRSRMIYAVAARAALMEEQVALAREAGLNLQAIDITEFALRNIAALLPEDGAGVVLLALHAHSGVITLTRQSTLYLARTIDIGAEELHRADARNPEELYRLLDGIALEIQRTLDYYESHFSQSPITSVVVAPLRQKLPALVLHLASSLGIAARMLDCGPVLGGASLLSGDLAARCLSALGGALRVGQGGA